MDGPLRFAQLLTAIDAIREDFASLDDWEDRYRYVIELGHGLEPLSPEAHNDTNKVRGCVSQGWLECEPRTAAAPKDPALSRRRRLSPCPGTDFHLRSRFFPIGRSSRFSQRMRTPPFASSGLSGI